jgi:Protein of unknown function (DUF3768)
MNMSSQKIAEINDHFRSQLDTSLGKTIGTEQVNHLDKEKCTELVKLITEFSDFNEDNDPCGEHDFGSVVVAGEKYFWKIDYYDLNYEYGSADPANTAVTKRLLTVMHSSEY